MINDKRYIVEARQVGKRCAIEHCELDGVLTFLVSFQKRQSSDFQSCTALVVNVDSQTVLGWIHGTYRIRERNVHVKLEKIFSIITNLKLEVAFKWVHAHAGTDGNELADRLAKIGFNNLLQIYSWKNLKMPYFVSDWINIGMEACRNQNKKAIFNIMRHQWNDYVNGKIDAQSLSYHLKDWKIYWSKSFKDEMNALRQLPFTILMSLRSGHNQLKACKKYRKRGETDICDFCALGVPETIEHFLLKCPHRPFFDLRERFIPGKPHLRDVLFPHQDELNRLLRDRDVTGYRSLFNQRLNLLKNLMDYILQSKRFAVGDAVSWMT